MHVKPHRADGTWTPGLLPSCCTEGSPHKYSSSPSDPLPESHTSDLNRQPATRATVRPGPKSSPTQPGPPVMAATIPSYPGCPQVDFPIYTQTSKAAHFSTWGARVRPALRTATDHRPSYAFFASRLSSQGGPSGPPCPLLSSPRRRKSRPSLRAVH
jgi:hypothetical protein